IPCGVWTTSGWNWTPYRLRPGASKAAIGVDDEPATTAAPSGGATTESRCDIQTVCSGGVSRKRSDSSARSSVFPNSETPVRSTTSTGRSAFARFGAAGSRTTCDGSAAIVRRLFRDGHVVRVRLAEACAGDPHEAGPLHVLDRGRAAVAHRLAQPSDELVQDR